MVLLALLGIFLCIRRRRRGRSSVVDWESVRASNLYPAPDDGADSPESPRIASPMPSMPQMVEYSSNPVLSPIARAENNVSPRLMVHTSPRSVHSYMFEDDDGADPFADPHAFARDYPRFSPSPTIRPSEDPFVDQSSSASVGRSLLESPDLFLQPAPPMVPGTGETNRLSVASSNASQPLVDTVSVFCFHCLYRLMINSQSR